MTTVYFATNRKQDGTGEFGYGAQMVPLDPAQMTYAVTQVTNIDLSQEDSGSIANPTDVAFGDFSATSRADIIAAGADLMISFMGSTTPLRTQFVARLIITTGSPKEVLPATRP